MSDSISEMETIAYLQTQVPFLLDSKIMRDLRGHSRVPCFVIEKLNEKYFAKLYPGDRRQDLRMIEKKYHDLQIPTARIIELTYLPKINETFCIYEYIDGITFAELLPQMSQVETERLGEKVGQEIKKFLVAQGNSKSFQTSFDQELSCLLQITQDQQATYNRRHADSLPEIDLPRFTKSLQNLKRTVYNLPPNFTHTDINLTNIIVSQDRVVFVDTDGSKMAFRALDFRGNVWWCWNPELTKTEIKQEQAAYRGIYQGMFDGKIPDSFHQELSFTMLYEFLIRVQKYFHDDVQTHYSFLRWHENLEQTNYFGNYQFPWF